MGDRLEDKSIAITGAGRGIVRALALSFADEGARIVIADFGADGEGSGAASQAPADEVVAEIRERGGEAVAAYDDVATVAGGENVVRTAMENFGSIDGLVLNAGIMAPDKPLWELSEDEWDTVLRVNLRGQFCPIRAAIPVMQKQGAGRLIYFSSSAAIGADVDSYMGYQVLSVEEQGDGVQVKYKSIDDDVVDEIEAQYLVGCDGARSSVRETLGVGETNFEYSERYLIIGAVVADSEYLKARFPDGAKMIFDSINAGVVGKGPHNHIRLDFRLHEDSTMNQSFATREDYERAARELIKARRFDPDKLEIVRLTEYEFEARSPENGAWVDF